VEFELVPPASIAGADGHKRNDECEVFGQRDGGSTGPPSRPASRQTLSCADRRSADVAVCRRRLIVRRRVPTPRLIQCRAFGTAVAACWSWYGLTNGNARWRRPFAPVVRNGWRTSRALMRPANPSLQRSG